jgi:hypothetical protein
MHQTNGFIYTLVMQHLGLINIIFHAIICTIEGDQEMQDWVKLGLTSGCQDDRGIVDATTR